MGYDNYTAERREDVDGVLGEEVFERVGRDGLKSRREGSGDEGVLGW